MMTTFLLATNMQGSVLGGSGFPHRSYPPYGALLTTSGPRLAFTGQPRDPLTGCYHLGNGRRQFNPRTRRFNSPDCSSPFARGGLNAYSYCAGDPLNRVDPTGAYFQFVINAARILAPASTLFGAVLRTARNVIGRMQPGAATFPDPHVSTRVGNAQYMVSGATGIAAQTLNVVSMGLGTADLSSPVTWLNFANNVGTISASVSANFLAGRDVYRYLRSHPGQLGRVAGETLLELTFVDETLSAVARGVTAAGRRVFDAGRRIQQFGHDMLQRTLRAEDEQPPSISLSNLSIRTG
ncbi:RHS repeat-associated core domain-containing protein [Pseudomonas alabamensis]|uniref:RHS repeat-associated core domain-containing protein n=1 Tax=Pseudomonas alabamensis TaxID=3064349 RepID=UPI003F64B177